MDELIGRLAADAGVAAEPSIGIVLDFLAKEEPADKMKMVWARLRRVETLKKTACAEAGMSVVTAAGVRMMGTGFSFGQVQGVTRQFIPGSRGEIGEDKVGQMVGAIPGFSQFV